MWALRDTWSHDHHQEGGADPEIEPTVPIMALQHPEHIIDSEENPLTLIKTTWGSPLIYRAEMAEY